MTDSTSHHSQWFDFPDIGPVALQLGPFAVRWYALAYIVGLLLSWWILKRLATQKSAPFTAPQLDQLLNLSLFGIILGGRLGYVLFYNPAYYLSHPIEIVMIWTGGMSFHGGLLGVIGAVILTARRHKIDLLKLGDHVALVAPIGLLLGRLANFINGELYGRITSHPIGIIFPNGGPLPRHPSQLYEAGLEGVLLGLVLVWRYRRGAMAAKGQLAGVFLAGYGAARIAVELVREPDAHIGFLGSVLGLGLTMGHVLSAPMIAAGLWLIWTAQQAKNPKSGSKKASQ